MAQALAVRLFSTPAPQNHLTITRLMALTTPYAVAITVALSALVWQTFSRKRREKKLPPGPPSYPLIGQLLSAPLSFQQSEFRRMSQELKSTQS
jgi:hypothetical protein